MTSAKIVASVFSGHGDDIYRGTVYEDGVILYLAVSSDTAQQWAGAAQDQAIQGLQAGRLRLLRRWPAVGLRVTRSTNPVDGLLF